MVSLLVALNGMRLVGDRLGTVWVAVCDSVVKGSALPMDEEVRAVSVTVGRPELGEERSVGVRGYVAPKVAGGML